MSIIENSANDEINNQEDEERVKEQEKIIQDAKAPAKTNILNTIKFKNKLDEEIFNLLPLSDAQKEELILDVEFNTSIDKLTDDKWNGRLSPRDTSIEEIKQEVGEELNEK